MFLIKAYCLSLYDCTLWSLSCKSLHVIQVAINNVFRKVWNLPFKSHTAIVHCVARIFPICNLIFHRFNKLYSHAISHSSAIVKSTFLRSSSLIYTFFGHNYMSGHQYLKFYNSYDIYCANIIRNYGYYYAWFPRSVAVRIKQSKTDSFRQGLSIVLSRTELPLCLVAALLAYLVVRGNSEGPLFLLRGKPLTRPKLVLKLRKAVAVTGPQPEKYAGHSFRIGATTTTAVCGVPVDVIKTLGRWKSQAYQLYVRIPDAQLA